MYLSRLEVQGFKTFAKKTVIEFPEPKQNLHALTVIVGPNGSGKSNLTDAIRWCLGEQSMKQLRGKKSEDIIFSGSDGHTRSGVAEVTLTFNNADKALDVDFAEVTITRRIYRDGEAEYLLNGKSARLSDIQLLLAEAGIGQRTYTVVGQGMIDHVLTSSPEERKVFFDDATGVRGLQIKRHQSMLKLRKATENLIEVELLLGEIEPRLRMLKRQVKRLEKRESVEVELKALQQTYYGSLYHDLQAQLAHNSDALTKVTEKVTAKQAELNKGDEQLAAMEAAAKSETKQDDGMQAAQRAYRDAQMALADARQKHFEAERDLELAKVKAQSTWAPLPLSEIIKELDDILQADGNVGIGALLKLVRTLRDRLTKPNPQDFRPDPKMLQAIQDAEGGIERANQAVQDTEKALELKSKSSSDVNTEVFAFQRALRKTQSELHSLEQEQNQLNIERARLETRVEGLTNEMREEVADQLNSILKVAPENADQNPEATRAQILKLKHQLELIGGIDEETIAEYKETQERYDFLNGQMTDLQEAIQATEKIIDELDTRITRQSEKAFKEINKEFQKYFKVLFGGGTCSLIKLKSDAKDKQEETKVTLDRAMDALAQEEPEEEDSVSQRALKRFKKRKDTVAGIDIQATPPGKKLKALNLLSGGERALTSIALLSAIMATNPSPFVVLDEVDAALDEANTMRFANILDELRKLTQFIVVTHNRATMERGDLLYGVTMGDDGVSNLLSVNMSDIEETGTARR